MSVKSQKDPRMFYLFYLLNFVKIGTTLLISFFMKPYCPNRYRYIHPTGLLPLCRYQWISFVNTKILKPTCLNFVLCSFFQWGKLKGRCIHSVYLLTYFLILSILFSPMEIIVRVLRYLTHSLNSPASVFRVSRGACANGTQRVVRVNNNFWICRAVATSAAHEK